MRSTDTAHVDLGGDGILSVRILTDAAQSIANARDNLSAALEVGAGQRRPLLVDISEAQPLEAEVRHFYSGQVLVDGFTALALVIHASPFGRMMGNVYFRVARPGIPTRLFTEPEQARAWLMAYRV